MAEGMEMNVSAAGAETIADTGTGAAGAETIADTGTGAAGAAIEESAGTEEKVGANEPENAEDARLRAHFDDLMAQAEAFRRAMPDFDLVKELEDPDFFRWTSPRVGMPLEKAYMAAHGADMMREAMAYAVERTKANMDARAMAARGRPREGGLMGAGGASVGFDAARMTAKERAEIKARAARGERIVF